jgi:hypothetical protein
MDGMTIAEAPKRASIVRRIESIRNTWAHDIPEDTDWRDTLTREYWGSVVERFRSGDRVEVHSFDHKIQFTMLVLDVNTSASPLYLNIVFLPVYPPDLRLPEVPPQRIPRYQVRQAPGSSNFRVIDLSNGLPVHDNDKSYSAAQEMASSLERAIISAEAMHLADDFLRQHHAAEHPVTPVTPGARRTAKWREKQRAEAATAEGDAA